MLSNSYPRSPSKCLMNTPEHKQLVNKNGDKPVGITKTGNFVIIRIQFSRYNRLTGRRGASVLAYVRYNRRHRYLWKYTTGHITNTRNKHINTKCDQMGFLFILNSFLTTKPFLVPRHHQKTKKFQNRTEPNCDRYNERLTATTNSCW
jgi:hypothetical protein